MISSMKKNDIHRRYGTHMLLEAAKNYGGIKRFINVSTDEVYGETSFGRSHGLLESSRLEPTNPYAAAKVGGLFVVWMLPTRAFLQE